MWSEHCSYKSSRVHLKTLADRAARRCCRGRARTPGAVDIGDGLAAVFKIESHNHPVVHRAVPGRGDRRRRHHPRHLHHGRAADCAAELAALRRRSTRRGTRRLLEGVVAGIAGYGNCIGMPTVGGEIAFDAVATTAIRWSTRSASASRKASDIVKGARPASATRSYYVGAKTGRDGIHGATMASAEFDEKSAEKRPAVQVGDPFMEKLLLEACLELMRTGRARRHPGHGRRRADLLDRPRWRARGGAGIEIDVARCRSARRA